MAELEREQEELLAQMVVAAQALDRDKRTFFLSTSLSGQRLFCEGYVLQRAGLTLGQDLVELRRRGFVSGAMSKKGGQLSVTAAGTEHVRDGGGGGDSLARQEDAMRRMLDSQQFQASYPRAYGSWCEAERLLWAPDADRQFTTIGHKVREAMQEFATEVLAAYPAPDTDHDVTKVNRRLGAVIASRRESLGEARAGLLIALGDYSEATMAAIQRQEHGGQKEGHALTWDDARRVVFHAASVMYEFAVTLRDC